MTNRKQPELGDRAMDLITGFEGIVTGRCTYITGCSQLLLAPPAKDGDFKHSEWFDVDRCVIVQSQAVQPLMVSSSSRPGPDRPAPRR